MTLAQFSHAYPLKQTHGHEPTRQGNLGRGYSFEALRAKILFTEGAHFKKRVRPKFERQRDIGVKYSMPDDAPVMNEQLFSMAKTFAVQEPRNQHDMAGEVFNFGASISTLVKLIESGEL